MNGKNEEKERVKIAFDEKIKYIERQITNKKVEINKAQAEYQKLIEERKNTQDEYIKWLQEA